MQNEDMMSKFKKIISQLDPKTMQNGVRTIAEFMHTEQGMELKEQLKTVDKQKLLQQMGLQNQDDIAKQVQQMASAQVDSGGQGLKNMTVEQMQQKLKEIIEKSKKD